MDRIIKSLVRKGRRKGRQKWNNKGGFLRGIKKLVGRVIEAVKERKNGKEGKNKRTRRESCY